MSDFIKVNFKTGYSVVMAKASITMFENNGAFHLEYTNNILTAILSHLVFGEIIGKEDDEITKEEYDRLCKELGVE